MFSLQMMTAQEMAVKTMRFFHKYTFTLIGSVLIVAAGWAIAIFTSRLIKRVFLKRDADVTITKFLSDLIASFIIGIAALIALGNFGITIAPFIAGLSVLGFGTSFALQGPLSNYAAGATLVFTKPFKVGDIMEIGNWIGEVEDMTLARTTILTLDGTRIVIPNKKIIGEIIHNYSDFKKLDIKIGVKYASDVDRAIGIAKEVIAAYKNVAQRPAPKVGIYEFTETKIIIYARLWCRQMDYWDLLFSINKAVCDEFKKGGLI